MANSKVRGFIGNSLLTIIISVARHAQEVVIYRDVMYKSNVSNLIY
jgi:hypothetical protein